ncbi:ribonuclease P protein component [Kinneretia asaccharophila]|uniref:ribonuclease P protein component n=1 Tax=Roseateles asaccharophilus TaxID=582607 RepID=UPI0013C346DD|nr:ribonuclease P protein component [Roseateles asaccharophilus]MDN3543293.1 ribonuclease P protein component [Roseateles asaccharophilus]
MIGRIQRSADFERVLGAPSRVRSPHFAAYHVTAVPSLPGRNLSTEAAELSTADAQVAHSLVDETLVQALPQGCWLGLVVPKRHARRAVTRSLLKRQIRAAFASGAERGVVPPGLWVVRLRAPFDRKEYPSAASEALRLAARDELAQLVGKLARPPRPLPPAKPAPAPAAPTGA